MPSKVLDVEVRGLDVLRRKLETRRLFGPVKQELIRRVADAALKEARIKAKPHSADKGSLGRAISVDFEEDGLVAVISPHKATMGLAFTIEEGRRPGRRPPRAAITRWLISHGAITTGRKEEREVVERVRKDIMERGTKGLHFMKQAQDVANRTLRDRIAPTERAIEDAFEK